MAHGRKRSFLGGVLAGGVVALIAVWLLVELSGISIVEPGRPLFPDRARDAATEWARLSPFPEDIKSFTIITGRTSFTRSFRVTFFGEPAAISSWVAECPGITDPKCKKESLDDGSTRYEIPAGGGAAFAELIHHPGRGTVEIYTWWS